MKNLTQKVCVACEGGTPPLQGELLKKYLGQVDGWEPIHGTKIKKEFSFKNFKEALVFVNKVGEVAEEEGHHPDIHLVSYKNVVIELWTHAIGGLSENDFIVAAKIEKLLH
ncbi:MAG: 4a-hydroxytetrahydrobiopterin dehydratase [bacterium]|nr:4a-hydroxytetrahydrobiopterin dehydratase [bacterium]